MALPTELWLIIFDLVIQEGIVRVDNCDHTQFPYIQSILSTTRLRYHFHDSYNRLRLVCRDFKAILGDPPSQILLPSPILPLSTTVRAAIIDLNAWPRADFQLRSAEMLSCRQLVYLDVTCSLFPGSIRPNLSDFLAACAGRVFPDVQRLTLKIVMNIYSEDVEGFWDRLHDAFPLLVTLVVTQENHHGRYIILKAASNVVSFEYLEVLYLGDSIGYSGCGFSRLRHASIWKRPHNGPDIVTSSPPLESLLIRSLHNNTTDLNSCSRLRLLGVHADKCYYLCSMGGYHLLEHLWVIAYDHLCDYDSFRSSLMKLPRVLRITIELLSSASEKERAWIAREFQKIDFASIGMNMRPPADGDSLLVIDRLPVSADV